MKTFVADISLFFLAIFLLAGCLTSGEQFVIKPTDALPTQAIATVAKPTATTPVRVTATSIPLTNTPNPGSISAMSPDNRFSIVLRLSEIPVKLIIVDNNSKRETEIPVTYKSYNEIVGNGPIGFRWAANNKILMFVMYREPFSELTTTDFSCFVAVDLEKAKIVTMDYSVLFRGLWYDDESEMATLEHGGLNDIDDFYFPGSNCYKGSLDSECEISNISPDGTWELSQPDSYADVDLISSAGDTWKNKYLMMNSSEYMPTIVRRWTNDGKYVFFSPSYAEGDSKVYGLFRMDLANGNVVSLIGKGYISSQYFYYLSVSPSAEKIIYGTTDNRLVIKDLKENSKKEVRIGLGTVESISGFIWSPDEKKVIFAKIRRSEDYNVISADYIMVDIETGKLITLLNGEPNYLNVKEITNSEVILGEKSFSLADGHEQIKP
jgi:hypothetical protein